MTTKQDDISGCGKIVTIIGVIGSLIAIFTFLTGIVSIKDFGRKSQPPPTPLETATVSKPHESPPSEAVIVSESHESPPVETTSLYYFSDWVADWAIVYEYDFPPLFWSIGNHQYTIVTSGGGCGDDSSNSYDFEVSESATLWNEDKLYLRYSGISNMKQKIMVTSFNPLQETVAAVAFFGTKSEMDDLIKNCRVSVVGNDRIAQSLTPYGPYQK